MNGRDSKAVHGMKELERQKSQKETNRSDKKISEKSYRSREPRHKRVREKVIIGVLEG